MMLGLRYSVEPEARLIRAQRRRHIKSGRCRISGFGLIESNDDVMK
jgi:hypothetical protein